MNDCYIEPIRKPFKREALNTAMVAYLAVRGIGCPHCVIQARKRKTKRYRAGRLILTDLLPVLTQFR